MSQGLSEAQAVAAIVQSIASTIGLIIGGLWVYRRFVLNRERYPKATIEHQIIYKPLTEKKALLSVFVTITNTSNVLIPLRLGELWIQQILPLPAGLAESIDAGADVKEELLKLIKGEGREFWRTEVPWPVLESFETRWEANERIIEPNDQEQIRYDIFIDRMIQTIRIYSFFENAVVGNLAIQTTEKRRKFGISRKQKYAIGWSYVTMHDLNLGGHNAKPLHADKHVSMPLLTWINNRVTTQRNEK